MFLKRILTYSILSLATVCTFFASISVDVVNTEKPSTYIALSIVSPTIYAEEAVAQPAKATEGEDRAQMWNQGINALNLILGIVTALVSPAIMFAGWLMSPDWTSGDLFGLRTPMYALWVTVSNIVYFIYAILLVLIALGTMFGQDKFSYKVMLPKLALGILMVPFTWWFVQWTISIASVVTASVITIPNETMKSKGGNTDWMHTPSIPENYTIDSEKGRSASKKAICPADCIAPIDMLKKSSGMYGYMMIYAYSVFKFQEVQELPGGTDILKAGIDVLHQLFIGTIMFIIFGLLTLALIAVLLMRAIKLWMYAVFSPLFTFRFVAGSNMMGGDDDSFTIKEFIGLCFVPAIVGLTLSFGLIMVNAVSSVETVASTKASCNVAQLKTPEGCTILTIMSDSDNSITRKIIEEGTGSYTQNIIKFAGTTTYYNGKLGPASDEQAVADASSRFTSVLNSAGGIFGTLIIDVIALVFIWLAFMAAKGVSKAVGAAIQPFEDIGNKIGGMAKKLPQYTPLPIPGGSIKGMSKVADGLGGIAEYKANKRFEDSDVGKWIKQNSGQTSDASKLATTQGVVRNGSIKEIQENIKQYNSKDNKDLIDTLRKESDLLISKINSITTLRQAEKEAIAKIIKDPNASDIDKLKVQAAIQSGKWSTLPTDETSLKNMIDNYSKQGTSGGGTSSGTNETFTKAGTTGSESININIGGITEASINANTGEITGLTEEVKKHLANITEAELRTSINGLTKDQQDKIVAAMKEYLKKPNAS